MDLKENKNDLEIEDVSKTETNFRSLYGLTPEVENAISISIENPFSLMSRFLKKLGESTFYHFFYNFLWFSF